MFRLLPLAFLFLSSALSASPARQVAVARPDDDRIDPVAGGNQTTLGGPGTLGGSLVPGGLGDGDPCPLWKPCRVGTQCCGQTFNANRRKFTCFPPAC